MSTFPAKQLEEHGPEIVFIKGIHHTVADAISQLGYDPSVNQTAEGYFTTKVNKNSKAVRDKTGWQSQIQWGKLKVVTNKHEDLISCLQTTEGGWNIPSKDKEYPLKRDSKSTKQGSIIKDLYKNMRKNQKGFRFSTY
jgi:hypothetical protein